jgi:hypothetical protein
MQVFLVKNATGNNYSVEAGLADDVQHFDHHGKHAHYPPPSTNPKVPRLHPDDIVEITHVDADTLVALYRMAGVPVPKEVDLQLVEYFDTHGSSVIKDLTNPTFLWILGLTKARKLVNFPPPGPKEPVDVTDQIYRIFQMPFQRVVLYGKELQVESEKNYREGLQDENGTVGFWVMQTHGGFDPSRPYLDGYKITIVYRKQYQQIGLYAAPNTNYILGNTKIAGIQFLGHAKACGSPRGEKYTQEDAQRVFEELADKYAQPRVQRIKAASRVRYQGAVYRLSLLAR